MKTLNFNALTSEQRHFAVLVAEGKELSDAYVEAYGPAAKTPHASKGWALSKLQRVSAAIEYFREINTSGLVLSIIEKRELLAKVVRDESQPLKERMRALQIDNKMAGHEAPEQKELKVDGQIRHAPVIHLTLDGSQSLETVPFDAETVEILECEKKQDQAGAALENPDGFLEGIELLGLDEDEVQSFHEPSDKPH